MFSFPSHFIQRLLTEWQSSDIQSSGRHVGANEELNFLTLELLQVFLALRGLSVTVQTHARELLSAGAFEKSFQIVAVEFRSTE